MRFRAKASLANRTKISMEISKKKAIPNCLIVSITFAFYFDIKDENICVIVC